MMKVLLFLAISLFAGVSAYRQNWVLGPQCYGKTSTFQVIMNASDFCFDLMYTRLPAKCDIMIGPRHYKLSSDYLYQDGVEVSSTRSSFQICLFKDDNNGKVFLFDSNAVNKNESRVIDVELSNCQIASLHVPSAIAKLVHGCEPVSEDSEVFYPYDVFDSSNCFYIDPLYITDHMHSNGISTHTKKIGMPTTCFQQFESFSIAFSLQYTDQTVSNSSEYKGTMVFESLGHKMKVTLDIDLSVGTDFTRFWKEPLFVDTGTFREYTLVDLQTGLPFLVGGKLFLMGNATWSCSDCQIINMIIIRISEIKSKCPVIMMDHSEGSREWHPPECRSTESNTSAHVLETPRTRKIDFWRTAHLDEYTFVTMQGCNASEFAVIPRFPTDVFYFLIGINSSCGARSPAGGSISDVNFLVDFNDGRITVIIEDSMYSLKSNSLGTRFGYVLIPVVLSTDYIRMGDKVHNFLYYRGPSTGRVELKMEDKPACRFAFLIHKKDGILNGTMCKIPDEWHLSKTADVDYVYLTLALITSLVVLTVSTATFSCICLKCCK